GCGSCRAARCDPTAAELRVEALDETADQQEPADGEYEEKKLERQRHERRRKHEHAKAQENGGDDQVNHKERQEDYEPEEKGRLEFRGDEGTHEYHGRHLIEIRRKFCRTSTHLQEEPKVLLPGMAVHELTERDDTSLKRLPLCDLPGKIGLKRRLVGPLDRWRHDEPGEEERKRAENHRRWSRRRT